MFSSGERYRAHSERCGYRSSDQYSVSSRDPESRALVPSSSASRKQNEEMATYIEQLKNYYEQYIAKQTSEHQTEIMRLTGMVNTLKKNVVDRERSQETMVADNRILLEKLRSITVDKSLSEDMKYQYTSEISKLNVEVANLRQELQTVKTAQPVELNKARLAHEKEISSIKQAHGIEIEQLKLEFQPRIDLLEHQVVSQRETYEKRFKEEISTLKAKYKESLTQQTEQSAQKINKLEYALSKYETTHKENIRELSSRQKQLKEQADEKSRLLELARADMEKLKEEHGKVTERMSNELELTVKRHALHTATLETRCKQHKTELEQVQERNRELQEQLQVSEKRTAQDLDMLREQCRAIRAQHEEKETEWSDREKTIRAECERLVQAAEQRVADIQRSSEEGELAKAKVQTQTILIHKLSAQIGVFETQIEKLETKIHLLDESKHDVVAQLTLSKRKVKEHDTVVTELNHKITALTAELKLALQARDDSARQYRQYQLQQEPHMETLKRNRREIESLQKQAKEMREKTATLEEQLVTATTSKNNVEQQLQQTHARQEELQSAHTQLQTVLQSMRMEHNKLKEVSARLQEESDSKNKLIEQQATELDSLHKIKTVASKESNIRITEMKKLNKSIADELAILKHTYTELQEKHRKLTEAYIEVSKQYKTVAQEQERVKSQQQILEEVDTSQKEQIEILKTQYKSITNELSQQVSRHKKETKERMTELKKMREERTAIEEQNTQLQETLATLNQRYSVHVAQLKSELNNACEESQTLKSDLEQLEEMRQTYTALSADKQRLSRQLKQSHDSVVELRKANQSQQEELNALTAQEKKVNTRNLELQTQYQALELTIVQRQKEHKETILGLQTTVNELQVERDKLLRIAASKHKEMEELQHSTELLELSLRKDIEARDTIIASSRIATDKLSREHETLVKKHDQLLTNYERTQKRFQNDLELVKKTNAVSNQKITENNSKLYAQVKNERDALETQLNMEKEKGAKEIRDLNTTIVRLNDSLQVLQQELREVEQKHTVHERNLAQLCESKLDETQKECMQKLAKEKAKFDNTLATLRKSIREREQHQQKIVKQLEEETTRLKKQLEETELKCKKSETSLLESDKELQRINAQYAEQFESKLSMTRKELAGKIVDIRASFQTQMEQLNAVHASNVERLSQEKEQLVSQYEARLDKLQQEFRKTVEGLKCDKSDSVSVANTLREQLNEKEKNIELLLKNILDANTALTQTKNQHQRELDKLIKQWSEKTQRQEEELARVTTSHELYVKELLKKKEAELKVLENVRVEERSALLKEQNENVHKLSSVIRQKEDLIAQLRRTCSEKVDAISQACTKLKEQHKQELDKLREQHTHLMAKHAREIESRTDKFASLTDKMVIDYEKQKIELQTTTETVRKEKKTLLEENERLRAESGRCTDMVHAMQLELKKQSANLDSLQSHYDEKIKTLETIEEKHNIALQKIKEEHATVVERLLNTHALKIEGFHVKFNTIHQNTKEELVRVQIERDTLQQQLEEKQRIMETIVRKKEEVEAMALNKFKKLQGDHHSAVTVLETKNQELVQKYQQLQETHRKALESLNQEFVDKYSSKLNELQTAVKERNVSISQLQDEIEALRAELNSTERKNKIEELETILKNKNGTIEALRDRMKTLVSQETANEMRVRIDELIKQVATTNQQLGALRSEKRISPEEVAELRRRIAERDQVIDTLTRRLEREDTELRRIVTERERKINELMLEISSLRHQLLDRDSKDLSTDSDLRRQIADLTREVATISTLRNQIAERDRSIDSLKKQLQSSPVTNDDRKDAMIASLKRDIELLKEDFVEKINLQHGEMKRVLLSKEQEIAQLKKLQRR